MECVKETKEKKTAQGHQQTNFISDLTAYSFNKVELFYATEILNTSSCYRDNKYMLTRTHYRQAHHSFMLLI